MAWPNQVLVDDDMSPLTTSYNGKSKQKKSSKNKKKSKKGMTHNSPRTTTASIWPSNIVMDSGGAPKPYLQAQQEDVTTISHEKKEKAETIGETTSSWPSVVLDSEPSPRPKMCSRDEEEEREDSAERTDAKQHGEREGILEQREQTSHSMKPIGILRPSSFCRPSFSASFDDDDDASLESFESSLFDGEANFAYPFHPSVPLREARSNSIVEALWHLTTQCYMPPDQDMPY
jgi:hypothetical protein